MAKTIDKSDAGKLIGDKLFIKRARLALPILVRQAKVGQPIFYSDISEELGMPNARNMNFVLGAIGHAMEHIGDEWNEKIPLIQSLVINKAEGLPGSGISEFFGSEVDFKKLPKKKKLLIVDKALSEVYMYDKWDEILKYLNLSPIEAVVPKLLKPYIRRNGGGEGEYHFRFKEYIFAHPHLLGISEKITEKTLEYALPSQDTIDIAFQSKSHFFGIEVKSHISDVQDIQRGLFQCVKYNALIDAEQKFSLSPKDGKVILALEGLFPASLISVKNTLGIEVIDNLGAKMTSHEP